jgi:hypothetical protein
MARTGRDTKEIVKRTKRGGELLEEFSGAARKLHPGFDKLNKQDKRAVVTLLSLQRYNPDDSEYSNKNIRNDILSRLGVASGEYDDSITIDRDSAGRAKTLKKQKEQNPTGFAVGGMIHRGRKAMRGAD